MAALNGPAVDAYLSRLWAGKEDVSLITGLVRAARPRERAADYPTVADVPEALQLPENQSTLRLWFGSEGQLVAYAFVDSFHTLRFDLDPARGTPALEAELGRWADACLSGGAAAGDRAPELYASCHSDDASRLRLLARLGFVVQAEKVLHLERPMSLPIAEPVLPPGFRQRPLAGEAEVAEVAALHRAAFGTANMTTEHRLALLRAADYDPSLDLVAVAPSGELAAYALGGVRPEENALIGRNVCHADTLGTHPAYQGRGLALALLLALLRALQPRGYESARLSTNSDNAPMQRVAARAGFSLASQTLLLARPVSSPARPSPR